METSESAVARWESPGASNRSPSPTKLAYLTALYGTTPAAAYEQAQASAKTAGLAPAEDDDFAKRARELEREINKRQGR